MNKPVKCPLSRQGKAPPLQRKTLCSRAAISQVDHGSKMNFNYPCLNTVRKGWVGNSAGFRKQGYGKTKDVTFCCMGFLSSKTDTLQSCVLCIPSLAGKSVFGEPQHSHSPFVELVNCDSAVPSVDLSIVSKITRSLLLYRKGLQQPLLRAT